VLGSQPWSSLPVVKSNGGWRAYIRKDGDETRTMEEWRAVFPLRVSSRRLRVPISISPRRLDIIEKGVRRQKRSRPSFVVAAAWLKWVERRSSQKERRLASLGRGGHVRA
jgi:hypothetical protein